MVWDGEGTTITGTTYRNTYAWFMTLDDVTQANGPRGGPTGAVRACAIEPTWLPDRPILAPLLLHVSSCSAGDGSMAPRSYRDALTSSSVASRARLETPSLA